jgi:hypothetical protein
MKTKPSFSTRAAFITLSVVILCACPGMSPKDNARFQSVVAKNVSPGMPFATALQHLTKAGFSCDRPAAAEVSCTRSRESLLPYAYRGDRDPHAHCLFRSVRMAGHGGNSNAL